MAKARETDSSSPSSDDDEEIYEVEDLINHRRVNKRKIEYLVKWSGYSEEHDTWEAEANIFSDELIEKYWARQSISRADFLKGKKEKRKPPQPKEEIKIVKKLKVDKTEKTWLTCEPPNGLEWHDLMEVIDLFKTKQKELFGEVRWKNQEKTYMSSDIIRLHRPMALLKYFETHLSYN